MTFCSKFGDLEYLGEVILTCGGGWDLPVTKAHLEGSFLSISDPHTPLWEVGTTSWGAVAPR